MIRRLIPLIAGFGVLILVSGASAQSSSSASSSAPARRIFEVSAYGARPSDSSDDTTGIQRALDAAAAWPGGGSVHLAAGTYIVRPLGGYRALLIKSNVEIYGEGAASILKVRNNAGPYTMIFGSPPDQRVENIVFRNFRVDQNPPGNQNARVSYMQPQNVVQMGNFRNVTVRDMRFDPEVGVQALVFGGPGADGVVVERSTFRFVRVATTEAGGWYDHSSVYTEAKTQRIEGNTFTAAVSDDPPTAVEVHGGPGIVVKNNVMDGYQTGVIGAAWPDYETAVSGGMRIESNTVRNALVSGVTLWGQRDRVLSGALVTRNTVTARPGGMYYGVWLYETPGDEESNGNFRGLQITDNTINFAATDADAYWGWPDDPVGIFLAPALPLRDVLVRGNTITGSPATGIRLGNPRTRALSSRITIEGNTIVNAGNHESFSDVSRTAIQLDRAAMEDVTVRGNTIRDTHTPPLGRYAIWAYPSSITRVTVTGNTISPSSLSQSLATGIMR